MRRKLVLFLIFFIAQAFSRLILPTGGFTYDENPNTNSSDSCRGRLRDGLACRRINVPDRNVINSAFFALMLPDYSIFLKKKPKQNSLDGNNVFLLEGGSEIDQVVFSTVQNGIGATIPADSGVWYLEPCSKDTNDFRTRGNSCHTITFIPYSMVLPEAEPLPKKNMSKQNGRNLRFREYSGDYLCASGTLSTDRSFCCLKSCGVCLSTGCTGSCCGIGILNSCRDYPAPCTTVTIQKVVVAFTSSVANVVNTASLAAQAIAITNQGYANSRIPIVLQLVSNYTTNVSGEASGEETLLVNYVSSLSSFNPEADFHIVIYSGGAYCGLAFDVDCWGGICAAVVNKDCIITNFSFGHELGHLQGTSHNTETGSSVATRFPYARGYYMGSSANRRTVLCYPIASSVRINWFSNPNVSLTLSSVSYPTGVVNTADSAKALFESRYEHSSVTSPNIVIELPSSTIVPPVVQTLYSCTAGSPNCPDPCEHCACTTPYYVVYNYTSPKTGSYFITTQNPSTSCADTYLYIKGETGFSCPTDLQARDTATVNFMEGESILIVIGSNYNSCFIGSTVSVAIYEVTSAPVRAPSFAPTTSKPSKSPVTSKPTTSPKVSTVPSLSPTKSPTNVVSAILVGDPHYILLNGSVTTCNGLGYQTLLENTNIRISVFQFSVNGNSLATSVNELKIEFLNQPSLPNQMISFGLVPVSGSLVINAATVFETHISPLNINFVFLNTRIDMLYSNSFLNFYVETSASLWTGGLLLTGCDNSVDAFLAPIESTCSSLIQPFQAFCNYDYLNTGGDLEYVDANFDMQALVLSLLK